MERAFTRGLIALLTTCPWILRMLDGHTVSVSPLYDIHTAGSNFHVACATNWPSHLLERSDVKKSFVCSTDEVSD